jgi:hypothetical protein
MRPIVSRTHPEKRSRSDSPAATAARASLGMRAVFNVLTQHPDAGAPRRPARHTNGRRRFRVADTTIDGGL